MSDWACHPREMCGMLMTHFTNCVSAWRQLETHWGGLWRY